MSRKTLGMELGNINPLTSSEDRIKYINFKLAALGLPIYKLLDSTEADKTTGAYFINLFGDIIQDYKEKTRMVDVNEIGIHKRINTFFEKYFKEDGQTLRVVTDYFNLDHYGLARELSLPPDGEMFSNEYIHSYRIKQGILNNPKNDRRTTKGSFHIVEGDLAIPYDKKEVPKEAFIKLYRAAVNPPESLQILPFTSKQSGHDEQAKTFVALSVKPVVSPEVKGISSEKTMEVLFVAPGSLVSNLDFLESVFGNSGDPSYHANDSGLDVEGWSGHTGYILLAPHLSKLRKIDLGLPSYDDASERQRRDGMCYKSPDELYNDGQAFKLTCRDASGVAVTLIADNYFGYSKKEIKTQISFASNLFGGVEEEHAGGTIAFPRRNVGENFNACEDKRIGDYTFESVKSLFGANMTLQNTNYGIDKNYPQINYLPENIEVDLNKTEIKWLYEGQIQTLKLRPGNVYILPNGEKLHMEQHPAAPAWKLISTDAEGTFCHKPCTVSGGGKSEISKPISNAIIYGTYYVNNLESDLDQVEQILNYDYRQRWKAYPDRTRASRPILSKDRSLGSVIKLLSPSPAYSDEFNRYLDAIPNYIKSLVFMVKRFYRQSWDGNWRSHFTVDIIDGKPGNEIKFNGRKIRPSFLRVGFETDKAWRIFKLRMDFMPSEKLQMEDDVTASIMIPASKLAYLNPQYHNASYKFVTNCEFRFFQRPDDAIHKGYDKRAELDLSSDNLFATNFQPLTKDDVITIREDVMGYIAYSKPVKEHIEGFLESDASYCVVSSEPRLVSGLPSKNPRYLEHRSDYINPIKSYIAEVGVRLSRRIPLEVPVLTPVNAVLPGRRNNPPGFENGKKILPLSVYNPIHYQELPELFMDFISSLTGKSPSTTGAGSEGALTKGPFNMLLPIYDLNNALLSYALGDYQAFSTPAGHIGPDVRVDHDISILVPELWSRLTPSERDPQQLISEGSLEKIEDFYYEGKLIPASRLGYRMTNVFSYKYLGKVFDEPQTIFDERILKPEKQSLEAFVDGVLNIAQGQQKAALDYFKDGSITHAIPPLKALLYIMAYGHFEDKTLSSSEIRALFHKDVILKSEWYHRRLLKKQEADIALINRKIAYLKQFTGDVTNFAITQEFGYKERLLRAEKELEYLESQMYLDDLVGTIGLDENLPIS